MTLDVKRAGATTREKAEAAARRICETHGLPSDWKQIGIEKSRTMPNLCLVIGEVK